MNEKKLEKTEQNPEETKIIDGKTYKKVNTGYTVRSWFCHDGPGWDFKGDALDKYSVNKPEDLLDEPYFQWELVEE